MKKKILQELKTAYAKLGLSDEAFDGVASLLEKTVTEESQIATAIGGDDVKTLLTTIQGQVDSWKNKFYDKDKELNTYKQSHPEKKEPSEKKDDEEPEWARKLREQNERLALRLDQREKEEKKIASMASVKAAAKKAGCSDERALKLTEKMFTIKDGESDEDAAKRFEQEYNDNVKEYFGEGVVPQHSSETTFTSEEQFKKVLSSYADSKFPEKK